MQPATFEFAPITRGDSETLSFGLIDHDEASGQDTIPDLTGATVEWRFSAAGEPDVVKTTSANGGLTLDVAGGWVTWELDPVASASLKAVDYRHRARVTFANRTVSTVLAGVLPVRD